ncbi:MAG: hypothetical protein GY940_41130 [bacterium]|nr:hypothetical protein [bacterium]
MKKKLLLLVLLFTTCLTGYPMSQEQTTDEVSHDPLKYEIDITAQIVPFYAVDSKGEPVYDLKQEEFEIIVDGKPFDIASFHHYRMEDTPAPGQTQGTVKPALFKAPERINFVIIDSAIVGNEFMLGNSVFIVKELIRRARGKDAFMLFQSNWAGGLIYMTGPTKDKRELYHALDNITDKKYSELNVKMMNRFLRVQTMNAGGGMQGNPADSEEQGRLAAIARNNTKRDRDEYNRSVRLFAISMKQLRYILKSTNLSKTVYLISPGRNRFMQFKSFDILEDAAKAVNYGGSLFYIINPVTDISPRRRSTLKFMSDAVNGGFISGRDVNHLVSQVKKSTAAYYELSFKTVAKAGKRSRIKLKCKRKGVKLATIAYKEQEKPYDKMDRSEQRVFLMNVIYGGGWSRSLANVKKGRHKTMPLRRNNLSKRYDNEAINRVRVAIPKHMRKKKLHFYNVAIDNVTEKAEITSYKKKTDKKIEYMRFSLRSDKTHYFVVIDPSTPACIYNKVKKAGRVPEINRNAEVPSISKQ